MKRCVLVSLSIIGTLAAEPARPAGGPETPPAHDSRITMNGSSAKEADAFASPEKLTATFTDPVNIDLRWQDRAKEPGGCIVEYANHPEDEFIILAVFSRGLTTFRHPDLVPETRFIYRVRPFFGRPSAIVQITTGETSTEPAPEIDESRPPPSGDIALRNPATFADAAPTEVAAKLVSPTRAALTWKDRAADEDGVWVEISTDPADEFQPFALLEPNVTSYTAANLPPKTKCYFRIRPFCYGHASNLVTITTGLPPSESKATP